MEKSNNLSNLEALEKDVKLLSEKWSDSLNTVKKCRVRFQDLVNKALKRVVDEMPGNVGADEVLDYVNTITGLGMTRLHKFSTNTTDFQPTIEEMNMIVWLIDNDLSTFCNFDRIDYCEIKINSIDTNRY